MGRGKERVVEMGAHTQGNHWRDVGNTRGGGGSWSGK